MLHCSKVTCKRRNASIPVGFERMTVAMTNENDEVIVVGAGVIGLAMRAGTAAKPGRRVRVIDAGRIGGGASHGNCGTITPSHAPPLAAPGMVAVALRWMLTPDAPLYIKPRIDPLLWRWLLRLRRALQSARLAAQRAGQGGAAERLAHALGAMGARLRAGVRIRRSRRRLRLPRPARLRRGTAGDAGAARTRHRRRGHRWPPITKRWSLR